jgi:hypothetical protein
MLLGQSQKAAHSLVRQVLYILFIAYLILFVIRNEGVTAAWVCSCAEQALRDDYPALPASWYLKTIAGVAAVLVSDG